MPRTKKGKTKCSSYESTKPCTLLALPPEIRRIIYTHLRLDAKYRIHVLVDPTDLEITQFVRKVTCVQHGEDPFSDDCFFGDCKHASGYQSDDTYWDHMYARKCRHVPDELLPCVDVFGVCKQIYHEARPILWASTEVFIPTASMCDAFFRRKDEVALQNLQQLHLDLGHIGETFKGLPPGSSLPNPRRLRSDLGIDTLWARYITHEER